MTESECTKCGYRLPTEELRARFQAGLGHCPGCLDKHAEFRKVVPKLDLGNPIWDGNFS